MPRIRANGTLLEYAEFGRGERVVLVMGTGSPGRVWHPRQVPALVSAGHRVLTFDNRGLDPPPGQPLPTVEDIAGDVIALVESVAGGPARLVGTSMGAHVVQEVLVARPDLAHQAVLVATRGRSDAMRSALAIAEAQLYAGECLPPPRHLATTTAVWNLSPATLNDDSAVRGWLDLLELFAPPVAVRRAQSALDTIGNRLDAYRRIATPTMVVAFADDLITPPHLGREVADAIPGARYELVNRAGHLGYLERPEVVNALIVDFFRGAGRPAPQAEADG